LCSAAIHSGARGLRGVRDESADKPWALTGAKRGEPGKVLRSLFMLPGEDGMLEQHNYKLKAKYDAWPSAK